MSFNFLNLPTWVYIVSISFICSGCINGNKTTQDLYEKAKSSLLQENYSRAAENFLLVAHRSPTTKLGKKSAGAGIWLLTYQLVNSMLGTQLNAMLALRIITECDILIALDPVFAIKNRIHMCKIIAHLMSIRPVQDFDYKSLQNLQTTVNKYKTRRDNHIQQLDKSVSDYHSILSKQPVYVYQEISDQDMCIMKHVSEFLGYMQSANKYVCMATEINNAVLTKSTALNTIVDLDHVVGSYTYSSRTLVLSMRAMLAKIQILSEFDIDSAYICRLGLDMENMYKNHISKHVLTADAAKQCSEIIEKTQKIIDLCDDTQDTKQISLKKTVDQILVDNIF